MRRLLLALGGPLLLACEAKFAQRLVAPSLAQHPSIERTRTRPVIEIGPYVVDELERKEGSAFAGRDERSAGPARYGSVTFRVRRADQSLRVQCEATQRMGLDADLASVSDRSTALVGASCRVDAPSGAYLFRLEGRDSENMSGKLEGPSAEVVARIEIIREYAMFGSVIRREAPSPIAQAYIEGEAVAAMLLSRPERTWFDLDTGPVARDVLFSAMLGLRFLPGLVEG